MIDLDVFCREVQVCSATGFMIGISSSEFKELITRLREAEKDAARYRCIKSLARVIECEEFDMDLLDGQNLDELVDDCIEAMR